MIGERVAWRPEVFKAIAEERPVVVLESTAIAHGLPWPENLDTARAMEAAVRDTSAEPATVAIRAGTLCIGLTDIELFELARAAREEPSVAAAVRAQETKCTVAWERSVPPHQPWAKANRRDLAAILAAGRSAATTVSATLWIARRFALEPRVMATGGLGGVHRDAGSSFDISTDLDELARADGALVVCSGPKSILDLPATLEVLEARGVLVAGYQSTELPGFLVRSSGLPLEHRVDSPGEAADLVRTHRVLGLPGAVVLVQPVPEEHALEPELFRMALDRALDDAHRRAIVGKPLTPFLLDAICQATEGLSLRANCALLVANARLAAQVAMALQEPPARLR
jgi:pseudouridine-5'-phosphate glycosidase